MKDSLSIGVVQSLSRESMRAAESYRSLRQAERSEAAPAPPSRWCWDRFSVHLHGARDVHSLASVQEVPGSARDAPSICANRPWCRWRQKLRDTPPMPQSDIVQQLRLCGAIEKECAKR